MANKAHKKSLELAKQISKDELNTLIKKHEAYKNAGPIYKEYMNATLR